MMLEFESWVRPGYLVSHSSTRGVEVYGKVLNVFARIVAIPMNWKNDVLLQLSLQTLLDLGLLSRARKEATKESYAQVRVTLAMKARNYSKEAFLEA